MIGLVCGAIGGWCVLAALGSTAPHRAKLAPTPTPQPLEDLGEFTEIQRGLPPVPAPHTDLMALIPADCLTDDDPELHGRYWGLIAREWVL
jgi:hypothetical protein